MSKAPEVKGGVTQQQTPECTCGYIQLATSERYPTASVGRLSLAENHRSGGVVQANSASAAPSSARALAAAASPSLQGTRSFRDSGRSGDVNSPSVNASASSVQGERRSKESRRCGDVQLPKSPSDSASPSYRRECSIRDGRRIGDGQQQQQAKFPSGNGVQLLERVRTFRDSGRNGDVQHAKSPISSASPSFQGERSFRDSRRNGDVQQAQSSSGTPSPAYHGETSFRDTQKNGDVRQVKPSSVNASPSCQGECSLTENGRSREVQQQEKVSSFNASPAFERVRNLRDSIRSADVQQAKSPSVVSSSRATPVATSPLVQKCGSLGENVKCRSFQANAASVTSPSRAAPSTPSSSGTTSLKSQLAAGHKLYGALLVSFSSVVAEILGWAGYDFVVVDLDQLFPGDTFAALPVLQALESTGTPAIFRLPGDDPVLVNRALDMGPAGLMFSMIENEEAARNAVASCRYPPHGVRRGSRHMVSRASRYGLDASYMDRCEEELFVMCQVETTEALDHIMEIAGVEGVDCIQMGGLDFGASLGDPYLDFNKEKVLSRQRKVLLAGFATPESSPDSLFKRGYHLVSGAVDVVLLRDAAVADLRRNKPSLGT